MAQCFEYYNGTTFYGIYPVNVDIANCMTAPAANPWGYTVLGHYVGYSTDDYLTSKAGLFSGLTLDDITETSGLIILAWAIAWAFRNMRRSV